MVNVSFWAKISLIVHFYQSFMIILTISQRKEKILNNFRKISQELFPSSTFIPVSTIIRIQKIFHCRLLFRHDVYSGPQSRRISRFEPEVTLQLAQLRATVLSIRFLSPGANLSKFHYQHRVPQNFGSERLETSKK